MRTITILLNENDIKNNPNIEEDTKRFLQSKNIKPELCTPSYAEILAEATYRNDNYEDFGFRRELTEEEVILIVDRLYTDNDYIWESLLDEIDAEMHKIQ